MEKILALLVGLPLLLAIAIALSALYAWPVQLLWNYLMPGIFWDISFKQAWAITLLCNFLFKSSK